MIALAIADSPTARQLLSGRSLDVDYLEVHGPHAESALAALPVQRFLLHNSIYNWSLGHPKALQQHDVLARTLQLIERLGPPWLSIHLGFSAATVEFREQEMHPVTPPQAREQLFEHICSAVRAFARLLPIPLILENLDYCPTGAYEHICCPEFIAAVLEATECGMLLDLAHARVSAAALGMSINDYLDRLPLDRVLQLHVNGPRWSSGKLVDAHQPLANEDFRLLAAVLAEVRPRAITLEYNSTAPAILAEVARLRRALE